MEAGQNVPWRNISLHILSDISGESCRLIVLVIYVKAAFNVKSDWQYDPEHHYSPYRVNIESLVILRGSCHHFWVIVPVTLPAPSPHLSIWAGICATRSLVFLLLEGSLPA